MSKHRPRIISAVLVGLAAAAIVLLGADNAFSTPRIPLVIVNGQVRQLPAGDTITGTGSGTITGVTAGSGLTGGGTSGTVVVDVGAGSGLLVSADVLSIDQAYTQRQVTTTCGAGAFMTAIGSNGTATCTAEPGDISSVGVTAPITGGGTSGAVTIGFSTTSTSCAVDQAVTSISATAVGTCTDNQVHVDGASIAGTGSAGSLLHTTIGGACGADRAFTSMNGAGVPSCSLFVDSATANGGLVLNGGGNSLGMRTDCSAGQYLAYVGSAWVCTSTGTADNAFYGFGIDGALTFDGSSTVLGMAPSSSTYTLNRDIFATTISISSGVTIKEAGYRIFANTSISFGSGTSKITNNGTDNSTSGGGGGGGTGGGATGGGINSIGDLSNTMDGGVGGNVSNTGAAGVSAAWNPQGFGGAGGAGGTATAAGGAGGNVTASPTSNGGGWGLTELLSLRVLNQPTAGRFSCGTGGGGGGGGTGGSGNGGGGGGGGGCLFVASPSITGAGVIQAKGGNGANGGNGTVGGGGGGGGGGGLIVIVTSTLSAATYTTDVAGGTGGTKGTGGSPANGTGGSTGRVVTMDPGSPGGGGGGAGTVTSVTCGTGLTGGTITSSGTCAVDTTYVQRLFDPTTSTTYFTDFVNIAATTASIQDGVYINNFSGTSAATNQLTDETGHPGILRLLTGSTTTGRASTVIGGNNSESFILGGNAFTADMLIRPGTLCDNATNICTVACGFLDTITAADSTDGVYLKFDPAASSNWRTVTVNNTTKSEADTSPAAAPSANTWQHLGFTVNSAGTSVSFTVGGAAAGTVSTNLPSGAGRAFGFGCMVLKSAGTTSRTFDIDYLRLDATGMTR